MKFAAKVSGNKKCDLIPVKELLPLTGYIRGGCSPIGMLLLHKEPAYASDIIQKLKEACLIVVEGTLYPLLTRLKNDDLLSYEWIESTQGPPRKYYKLTEKGEDFLGELENS